MCTIVPISLSIGANRIVPTVSIPYPLGNPELSSQAEKALRRELAERALTALSTPWTGRRSLMARTIRTRPRAMQPNSVGARPEELSNGTA